MALSQYDPVLVAGTWGGITITDGAVAAEFFSTAQDNMLWTRESDLQGNGTRVKNNNRGGSFQITLSASSQTNNSLWLAYELDRDANQPNQVYDMILLDRSGSLSVRAENAFIEGVPDVSLGTDRGTRTWTFQCSALIIEGGGHDSA